MAGRATSKRVAMDSKPAKADALSKLLGSIKVGE